MGAGGEMEAGPRRKDVHPLNGLKRKMDSASVGFLQDPSPRRTKKIKQRMCLVANHTASKTKKRLVRF